MVSIGQKPRHDTVFRGRTLQRSLVKQRSQSTNDLTDLATDDKSKNTDEDPVLKRKRLEGDPSVETTKRIKEAEWYAQRRPTKNRWEQQDKSLHGCLLLTEKA